MYGLFLTVIISIGNVSDTNKVSDVTFNTLKECKEYQVSNGYISNNHLKFSCLSI